MSNIRLDKPSPPKSPSTPTKRGVHRYCLISCISARYQSDNRMLSKEVLSKLTLRVTGGGLKPECITCECVNHMCIPVDSFPNQQISVSVDSGGNHSLDHITIPVIPGCRVSYFAINEMNIVLCIVHDTVEVSNESELFIEEQDFLYNCLNIQEELFLREIPDAWHGKHPIVVNKENHKGASRTSSDLETELNSINSLLERYSDVRSVG